MTILLASLVTMALCHDRPEELPGQKVALSAIRRQGFASTNVLLEGSLISWPISSHTTDDKERRTLRYQSHSECLH